MRAWLVRTRVMRAQVTRFWVCCLLGLLLVPIFAQDAPGRKRLILKDRSYQVVLRYELKGDRVRYRSAERDGWEELPADQVDWAATGRFNHDHARGGAGGAPASSEQQDQANDPGAQAAAELDRQAAAQRADEAARQPEVAKGLRLPDESGVWALDEFNAVPELIRIRQSDGDLNLDTGHSVKGAAIPQGGARDLIRLEGYRAVVAFHVARPVFYIRLDEPKSTEAPEDALVVDTHGASRSMQDKTEHASPDSTYALVRLRVVKNLRAASAEELRGLRSGGELDGSAEVVATERTILPGRHWMRVSPRTDLNLGQYSLLELLGGGGPVAPGGFNLDGWDFGVNPLAPENKGGFRPVVSDSAP